MFTNAAKVIPLRAPVSPDAEEMTLDDAFFALSDPVRRKILTRLDDGPLLVSELARPFDISLRRYRATSMLVRAGWSRQSGRRISLPRDVGPICGSGVDEPLH